MNKLFCATARRMLPTLAVLLLLSPLTAHLAAAQDTQAQRAADTRQPPQSYETLFIAHLTESSDARDLVTDLRNMLPRATVYYVRSQNAISIHATADELQLAHKVLADIDQPRKAYRVTYAITGSDAGKGSTAQRYTLIVLPDTKAVLKQGDRVPIVTGNAENSSNATTTQVQYVDIGLNIEATLEGDRLRTKIEETGLSDEKSGLGTQDPIVRQTMVEAMAPVGSSKPVILGSVDIPGTTRHKEISVSVEPVQ